MPKLIKAVQSSPDLANQWLTMLNDPENRISLKDMYRNYNTLESLIDKAKYLDSEYSSKYLEMNKQDSGSCCSSSCEPFQ